MASSGLTTKFALLAIVCVAIDAQIGNPVATEVEIPEEFQAISYAGANNEVILVLTEKHDIWRSPDEGKTWFKANLPDSAVTQDSKNSGVLTIYVSKVDPTKIFLVGWGKFHWVSSNAGASWTKVITPFNVDIFTEAFLKYFVSMHPTNANALMMILASAGCTQKPAVDCYRMLYGTPDFGTTWQLLDSYVVMFGWANETGSSSLPPDAIFATEWTEAKKTGSQNPHLDDSSQQLVRSLDLFQTKDVILTNGVSFRYDGDFLFAVGYHPEDEDNPIHLLVSTDDQHLVPVQMPKGLELDPKMYRILDTTSKVAFLFVMHGKEWGHLYVSNVDGTQYVLSLTYVHGSSSGVDFMPVPSLEGVYMANVLVDPDASDDPDNVLEFRTMITFDRGGSWQRVAAPAVDSNGAPIKCDPSSCSLHLHGRTSYSPGVYSVASAIGLIIATGNTGPSLDMYGDVNTYFSRDGGLTWTELQTGSYIYEYGDHGAILVMAKSTTAVTEVLFSWDEGASFHTFKVSDEPILVWNIIVEPQATADTFLLYGTVEEELVLIQLDFSSVQPRVCQGFQDGTGDYEVWSASDGRREPCLLGREMTYVRRKQNAQCYNSEDVDKQQFVKNCTCDEKDWECDFGYEPVSQAGLETLECAPIAGMSVPTTTEPPLSCPSGTTYEVTRGYRKVGGDSCEPAKDDSKSPLIFNCPSVDTGLRESAPSGGHGVVIAVVVILVVFVGGLAVLAYIKRDKLRSLLPFGSNSGGDAFARLGGRGPQTVGLDDDDEPGEGARALNDGDIRADLEADDEEEEVFVPITNRAGPTPLPPAWLRGPAAPAAPAPAPAPAPASAPINLFQDGGDADTLLPISTV